MVPQQWRDLQQALEKERASSLKLQTEVNRIRQEMQTAKMEGNCLARRLRLLLQGHGFICNRIAFDAVTPFVDTAPIETDIETGSFRKLCQKWSVLKARWFIGLVNGETASI